MNELAVVDKGADWRRLKCLGSIPSPPDYEAGVQPSDWTSSSSGTPTSPAGFTKATVAAWRVALEARGLGAVSINVRITSVRKLAVEASEGGLLAPELANGITRVKGVASKGVRLGNWLTGKQAQALLNAPDASANKGTGRFWPCSSAAASGALCSKKCSGEVRGPRNAACGTQTRLP